MTTQTPDDSMSVIARHMSKLQSERDAALALVAELEVALRQHHNYQLDMGTIYIKHGDAKYHEIDMSDAYAESGLCDQTTDALAKAEATKDKSNG